MKANYKVISLFAGVGGLDIGLEQAGFDSVAANELEAYACESLRMNKILSNLNENDIDKFIAKALSQRSLASMSETEKKLFFERLSKHPKGKRYLQNCEIVEGDIRNIPSNTFRNILNGEEPYCIAGGPPCQPFSKAGKQKSLDCAKNGDLFFEFVRVVKDLSPRWFLFENVKGITFTKTDVIYAYCNDCHMKSIAPFSVRQDFLKEISPSACEACYSGNTVYHSVNEPGGSLKIIINEFEKIGYKCSAKVLNAADFGAPQIRERLFIVGNRDGVNFEWPQPTHRKSHNRSSTIDLFEGYGAARPWVTMKDAIWPNYHSVYGEFDDRARLWVKNVVRPHDEPVTWNFDRPSPTIGAHQAAKLAFAPEGVPEKQLVRQQWATKGRKQGDTPPVKVEHEYLSDEELLKLQTFPSWWYLHGTRMQRAFQIGNAVPPLLGRVMGEAIIKIGKSENE